MQYFQAETCPPTASGPPQLPPEVWNQIISFVAGVTQPQGLYPFQDLNSWRADLRSCCLVCCAFVARSRFFLFEAITIKSGAQAMVITKAFNDLPVLYSKVHSLALDGSNYLSET